MYSFGNIENKVIYTDVKSLWENFYHTLSLSFELFGFDIAFNILYMSYHEG